MTPQDAGFTLIEALIAMAVLAAGAVGLLTVAERHATLARQLADRTVARWVAEDRLTEIALGLPAAAAPVQMLGGQWRAEARFSATSDPDLVRVDVRAAALRPGAGADAATAGLTGFVDAAVLPPGDRP